MEIRNLKQGQKVVGYSGMHGMGPDHRTGTFVGIETNRWGTFAKIALDEGGAESVSSFVGTAYLRDGIIRGMGQIGWYAVEES